MFWGFWKILENPVLGWKIRFSAKISNYAKIPWNTQKTPTKHVLRLFKKFLKIRFTAQTSGSRLRCRTMLKIPWNSETPTKHVLRLFKNFLKIRFSAQKSGSRPRCRTMLKIFWNTQKTPTKHALRHFKNFSKLRFLAEKSGSRLRCRIMLKKYHETLRKHQLNMFEAFWEILENPVLCYRCRTMLKIPWNTQKTPPKHVLILNNLLAMVRRLGQPTPFIILQMICTDQNWGSC